MASDTGTKAYAKAEYTGWLVAIFKSERVFPGWLPGCHFCLRVKLSTNSRQLSLLFDHFLITRIDCHELKRVSALINSRSRLARALDKQIQLDMNVLIKISFLQDYSCSHHPAYSDVM